MTPIYKNTIPKLYSTYTVTIAYFSCPPREATPAARDPHFPSGIPFKLFGNIYLIISMSMKQRFWRSTAQYGTGIYFYTVISTPSGHPWSPAPTIYFNAVISTLERHGTATVGEARAPQVQEPSAMFFFVFCFCFLLTVVLNKDENGPNSPTSCPTDYILTLPPCRKPCAMIIWSKF